MSASRLLPLSLALLALAALGAAGWILFDRLSQAETPAGPGLVQTRSDQAGPFRLTDASGRSITEADFAEGPTLLYFGYSFCPDVCPTTLSRLVQAVEALGQEVEDVSILFVSVDPERDGPEQLQAYAEALGEPVVAATGSEAELKAMTRAFAAVYRLRRDIDPVDYPVDHSSQVYLMSRDWELLAVFAHDATEADFERVLREIL